MRTRASGIMLLVAFIAGQGTSAFAATEVQHVTFTGSQVAVGFFGSGEVTCADGSQGFVSAFGSLSGAQQVTRSTGTPQTLSNGVFVEIDSYFNTCTNQALSGTGGIANGFTPPDKQLTSAALVGTASVQDFSSGATIPVSINITVQGVGNTSQSKSNSQSKTIGAKGGPLMINVSHFANSNRSGTATGTISIGGVAIDPQFFFAILIANDNASTSISRL
jgi:hypothetical protein